MDSPEVEVARYAARISLWALGISVLALVATAGSLALEVRRWFDEGVKLSLNVMTEANLVGGNRGDPNDYLLLTVTSRGNAPTAITHMMLYDFPTRPAWLFRRRKSKTMIIPEPTLPGTMGQLPHTLPPGQVRQGIVTHTPDLKQMIAAGRLHVGVVALHTDKPLLKRVRQWKPPKDAKAALPESEALGRPE